MILGFKLKNFNSCNHKEVGLGRLLIEVQYSNLTPNFMKFEFCLTFRTFPYLVFDGVLEPRVPPESGPLLVAHLAQRSTCTARTRPARHLQPIGTRARSARPLRLWRRFVVIIVAGGSGRCARRFLRRFRGCLRHRRVPVTARGDGSRRVR